MGKKTRRKHRHSNNNSQPADNATAASSIHQAAAAKKHPASQQGPAILQRIRHADPKTRHAALAALLHTTFDPALLQRNNSSNSSSLVVPTNLLQAVREQVASQDLTCAVTAAGCLANYAAFASPNDSIGKYEQHQHDALTAGWMVLLTGRLQQCLRGIQQAQQEQETAAIPKSQKLLLQWYELAEQCLATIVHLLENNSLAVERLVVSNNHIRSSSTTARQLRNDSMAVVTDLLHQSLSAPTSVVTSAVNATTANAVDHQQQLEAALARVQSSVQTFCCRCFHSAWDDNPPLLLPWLQEQPEMAKRTLDLLHQLIVGLPTSSSSLESSSLSVPATAVPAVTRLHAVGAWIAAWTLCRNNNHHHPAAKASAAAAAATDHSSSSTAIDWAARLLHTGMSQCLSILQQSLTWNVGDRTSQVQHLRAAHAAYVEQQADDTLEREVVSAQDKKKEPARLIARRLKQQQQEKQQQAAAMAVETNNCSNHDADDDHVKLSHLMQVEPSLSAAAAAVSDSPVEDWETAQNKWLESIRPVQMALEITANLTSVSSWSPVFMHDQDDEDDENQVMAHADDDEQMPGLDPELAQLLVQQYAIPDQLFELLGKLVSRSWQGDADEMLPPQVREPLSDMQSKTAVCLGHCLTNLGRKDEADDATNDDNNAMARLWTPPTSTWSHLKDAWHAAADASAQEAMESVMVVALRSFRSVRTTQIQSTDLDFLLQLVLYNTTSPIAVRDAVCMLGILCSQESHSAEINHKVVHALITATSTTTTGRSSASGGAASEEKVVGAMVLSEVLSVLMDIYGDDGHPEVFDSLNVLNHFQRSVPLLKQRISVERDASPEDVEQWKDTATNAARFIQYKKGHEA